MQKKSKEKSGLIIIYFLIFVLAIAVGVYFLYSVWRNDRVNGFKTQVDKLESLMTNLKGSSLDLTDYEQLILKCNNAINENEISNFNELETLLKDGTKYLGKLITGREELEALETEYTKVLKKYRVTESYQEAYEDTMTSLDAAITAYNISEKNDLTQALEALEKGLSADNQKEIQTMKNTINTISTDNATNSELEMINGYQSEVEELVADGDYLTALGKLDIYLDFVTAIDARVTESEPEIKVSETYVLEGSDQRKLAEGDVSALSVYGFELAICEIYARHGATFSDEQIQAYFDAKTWYVGTTPREEIDAKKFNKYETANLKFLNKCKVQAEEETVEETEELIVPDE